eukprot:6209909-Pleurochrysis_carterae.AAC.1
MRRLAAAPHPSGVRVKFLVNRQANAMCGDGEVMTDDSHETRKRTVLSQHESPKSCPVVLACAHMHAHQPFTKPHTAR